MVSLSIDLSEAISEIRNSISRHLGYLSSPRKKIRLLNEAVRELAAVRNDVNNRVSVKELLGETRTGQVTIWIDSVTAIEGEARRIVQDYEQSRCVDGCSIPRWSINRRATRTLARVADLWGEIKNLQILTERLPPRPVQEMPHASAFPGMRSNLDEVRGYLNGGVGIIGIWGMGGVGKTALLQCINNDFLPLQESFSTSSVLSRRRGAIFDHVILAVVSKEYTVKKLQKVIAGRLGVPLQDDEQEQATAIFNHLNCRNFLLLLDDLWRMVDLRAVGVPLPSRKPTGPHKHKVVFTTRMEQVCGAMGAHTKIKISCLEEDNAWQLFREMVGLDTLESDPRIPNLARQVVLECHGLPLALIVIGKAMSTRKTPKEWQNAITLLRRSKLPEMVDEDEHMLPRLKLSYDYLPDDAIRKCFLLCSLWPEGCSISKSDIIECWMGHGLIDVGVFNDINEAYDSGHTIIGTLKSACLLEPGDDEDDEVKMHDIIGDMARWIGSDRDKNHQKLIAQSGGTSWRSPADLKAWAMAEQVSLIQSEISRFPDAPPECPNLVTLMLQQNLYLRLIPGNFFVSFPALTYLDLSCSPIIELPSEISRAINLRYLNLSLTEITRLPESLRYLSKLKFLILRYLENLTDIPSGVISKLSNLEVLDLSHTPYAHWVEFEALTQGLRALGITVETCQALIRLSKLDRVMVWRLAIRKLPELAAPPVMPLSDVLRSHNMTSSLQQLRIEYCKTLVKLTFEDQYNWCFPKLEILELKELEQLMVISWFRSNPCACFPALSFFRVSHCGRLKHVGWIHMFQYLEQLDLHACAEMESVIDDDEHEEYSETELPFPSLKRIYLSELPKLTLICRRQFIFPSLDLLRVINCPALRRLPFSSRTPKNKLRICGDLDWWRGLEWQDGDLEASLLPFFTPRVQS